MAVTFLPVSNEVEAIFRETVASQDGVVSNCVEFQAQLYMRSTTPRALEVRPRDLVQGGVALRMIDDQIDVCPYVFRQVCRNGAVMPLASESFHVLRVDLAAPTDDIDAVSDELRQVLGWCLDPSILETATDQMQLAVRTELTVDAEMLDRLPRDMGISHRDLRHQVVRRLRMERDWTVYGLMNALTSLARDTQDPEIRWNLEELGGGVLAQIKMGSKPGDSAADPIGLVH